MEKLLDKKGGSGAHGTVDQLKESYYKDKGEEVQRFDFLAADSAERLSDADPARTIVLLDALGAAMVTEGDDDIGHGDSNIPPVYTYWGQFIDHDITLNTGNNARARHSEGVAEFDIRSSDFVPVGKSKIRESLINARTRQLDLDSVYGDGPDKDTTGMYDVGDPAKHCHEGRRGSFALGLAKDVVGVVPGPDSQDTCRDLPRRTAVESGTKMNEAVIGDSRNDENLIIAQFHTAFLRFHNRALKELDDFERARNHTRWHYQWLVLHDFLPKVARTDVVKAVLDGETRFNFSGDFMPLEFSTAAYRFGHSMVRSSYDFNANFGRDAGIDDRASFNQLFQFTGHSASTGQSTDGRLPSNWIVDWSRLAVPSLRFDDGLPERLARRIDTRLSDPLGAMANEGNGEVDQDSASAGMSLQALMKHLAKRNLRRGFLLQIPTGQAMAAQAGLRPLSEEELLRDPIGERVAISAALHSDGGFLLRHTPLWFYILKEAEVREGGLHLGELGSRLVVETLIGIMRNSSHSVLASGWAPENSELQDGSEISDIRAFLRYARVL